MAFGIRAEQRDTRSCVRVVEIFSPRAASPFAPGILPPAGNNRRPDLKQRLESFFTRDFAAGRQKPSSILKPAGCNLTSRAVQLVEDAPRSGAHTFDYIELFPARGVSGKNLSSKLKVTSLAPTARDGLLIITAAPRSGALLSVHRSNSGERDPSSRTSNLTQSNSRHYRKFDFSPSGEGSLRPGEPTGDFQFVFESNTMFTLISAPREPPRSVSHQSPRSKSKIRFFGIRRAPSLYGYASSWPEVVLWACNLRKLDGFQKFRLSAITLQVHNLNFPSKQPAWWIFAPQTVDSRNPAKTPSKTAS
ncbi:hypothetical protein R3P38DRAFT_2774275 [Favolaschia claudopus]|uniref:Uncharacterized protein n=1 Tax=Favolaschia claudopus TaxID=2862362 RepID=A0AAW0BZY5_9AGAR